MSSAQTPVERVTIASRSHSAQPATPLSAALQGPAVPTDTHHPGETVFDEDEETESFYVILDISGDDFAEYGKYRDGKKFRPRLGDFSFGDEEGDEEDQPPVADEEDAGREDDEDEDAEGDDGDESSDGGGGRDGSKSDSASSSDDSSGRELVMQILDLDTYNPLVNYEGKIYSCKWNISNGTEMIFAPPPGEDSEAGAVVVDREATAAAAGDSTGENFSRKLRRHPEASLVGTTIHRLEGWPARVKPKGRDKQEVSTKARMFAERLDAVLEHRLSEMKKKGEDVSEVTMKKFSEGQQPPWMGLKELPSADSPK